MSLAGIPLFSMLQKRLGYLTEQQKVLSENIANADTAKYVPEDLKAFSFQAEVSKAQAAAGAGPGMMAVTQPGHMQPKGGGGSAWKSVKTPDSETTMNGNSVVLEEEMIKMSDARMNYDAAISFYQKSMNLLRMASRAPGRGG